MSSILNIAYKTRRLHESTNEADTLYWDYLERHKRGVFRAYKKLLPSLLADGVGNKTLQEIEDLIKNHDSSKYDKIEFEAYRNYFYDRDKYPRSSEDFATAWNHHQKSNPHHWNYWVLINDVDKPQFQPLDMPFKYIIELLCDWQSAGEFYGNTALEWWESEHNFIMTDYTKSVIEKYIRKVSS